jgi:hypothetical protein
MFAREICAMRTKSYARLMNAANDDANGFHASTCMPTAAATICCSAMYISKYRSGCALAKISAYVEFETSPSSATTRGSSEPSAARRIAVGAARRDLRADLVRRPLDGLRLEAVRLRGLGLRDVDDDVADAAELLDRLLGDRLPVPAVLVLDLRVPLPLIVFATIAVGCPVVDSASRYAASIASTSWPSTSIAFHPVASSRPE